MKRLLFLLVLLPFWAQSQNIINTIAGSATSGYTGDGGPATAAGLYNPSGAAYDNGGNLYISDADHNTIRKVTPGGIISTIAGTGTAGFSGDGGPATSADLNRPIKLYIDAANNIYFADFNNHRIRKITAAGIISTVAGNGSTGYTGDGVPATATSLWFPCSVTFDVAGNMYICDYINYRIRKVNPAGIISTYAGNGFGGFAGDGGPATSASIFKAFDIEIDNLNNMYIADASNNRVRKVNAAGTISTIAGTGAPTFGGDGGAAVAAPLNNPAGLALDGLGSLYIADQFNYRVRKINSAGVISTVAANGTSGFSGDGGPVLAAQVSNTNEIVISPQGDLVICDDINNRVRKVTTPPMCDTIVLADTITACRNTTVTLAASMGSTGTLLNVDWTPGTLVSDSTIMAPTVAVSTASNMFYITAKSTMPGSTNLVVNGDFSLGNTGFSSSYTYAAGPSTVLNEGFYSVYTNPFSVHTGFTSFADHTTGTGNMLIINGAGSPVDLWCQTITVTPNTDYDFSAWFANCSSVTTGAFVPILQFKINGVLIGSPTTATAAPGTWSNFDATWNSGTATSATICIYNLVVTTNGNDFVLDDITFRPYCIATDSVYVKVLPYDTTIVKHDSAVCTGNNVVYTAPAGYTSYTWSNATTTSTFTATAPGTYWVISANNCSRRIDTFKVRYRVTPTVALGNDTGICLGGTIPLSSLQPTTYTFMWSNGATTSATSVNTTGDYWVVVSDSGCTASDTIHTTFLPPPIVDLGPDAANCEGNTIALSSSVPYVLPVYLWNTGATTPSITATATGTYWLRVTDAGCPGSDTIQVIIVYDTLHLYTPDTAICMGQIVQVMATANPTATYQWIPTAGIASPNTVAPTITPDTTAMYHLIVYMTGCPPKEDSFLLDVQPNPTVYLGGNRFVCVFDTLHLTALAQPQWYSHYSYSWTPATYLDNTNTSTVVYSAGATQQYVLTVTTPAGCKGADSAVITVYPGNFASTIGDKDICPRDSVQLITTGGISYSWQPNLGVSDTTSPAPWVFPITSQTYTAVATSADGCHDTVQVHINVWPGGVVSLPDSVTLYPGESYHMMPYTNCSAFMWFPTAGVEGMYLSDPTVTPEVSTRYIIYGTTEHGCMAQDSIYITVNPESLLEVPNAFSPGSTNNSAFSILKRGVATLNYFRVYNRWGNLLFETKDINKGWDGTYEGVPQPFAVYVYDIQAVTLTGQVFSKHGNVTLLR